MTIRFQADADFNQNIVTGVLRQEPTIDFKTALAANLQGLPDRDVLKIAAQERRILVSHDRRTMPIHFAKFITQQNSSGIIIVSQDIVIQVAIENLILIWAASSIEEWVNRIAFLPL